MNTVHLHIDELVLDGFNPADRHRIADAIQHELGRLISERGLPSIGGERAEVDGGQFQLPSRVVPSAVGGLVAKQLHGALSVAGKAGAP